MSALQVQLLYLVYPFCAATIRGEEPILSGTSTRDSLKKKNSQDQLYDSNFVQEVINSDLVLGRFVW